MIKKEKKQEKPQDEAPKQSYFFSKQEKSVMASSLQEATAIIEAEEKAKQQQ